MKVVQHIIKSHEKRSYYMIYLKVAPLLDVRSDPRFVDVMRRVGHSL